MNEATRQFLAGMGIGENHGWKRTSADPVGPTFGSAEIGDKVSPYTVFSKQLSGLTAVKQRVEVKVRHEHLTGEDTVSIEGEPMHVDRWYFTVPDNPPFRFTTVKGARLDFTTDWSDLRTLPQAADHVMLNSQVLTSVAGISRYVTRIKHLSIGQELGRGAKQAAFGVGINDGSLLELAMVADKITLENVMDDELMIIQAHLTACGRGKNILELRRHLAQFGKAAQAKRLEKELPLS